MSEPGKESARDTADQTSQPKTQDAGRPKASGDSVDYAKKDGAQSQAVNPNDPENLTPGEHYKIFAGQNAFTLDAPWFLDGAVDGPSGAGKINPPKMSEILSAMRDQGMLSWVTPETIDNASKRIGIAATSAPQLKVRFNADSFAIVGLPPNSAAMVSFAGGALLVTIRTKTNGLEPEQRVTVTGEHVDRVYRAIETFTGLKAINKVPDFAMYVGTEAFTKRIASNDLTYIFGPAWTKWAASHGMYGDADKRESVTGAQSVDESLTTDERAYVSNWLATHLRSTTAVPGSAGRDILAMVQNFEAKYALHPEDRARILDRLRQGQPAIANARALRLAIEDAEFENERHHAGLAADPVDAARETPTITTKIPARLHVKNDVLIDGDELAIDLDVDWKRLIYGSETREKLSKGFSMIVEWVVSRAGVVEKTEVFTSTSSDAKLRHTLTLPAGFDRATWRVDAFVKSNSFSSTHLEPVLAEATSKAVRLDEQRKEAIGDTKLDASMHQFPTTVVGDQILGGGTGIGYLGKRFEGEGFTARTPAERMKAHGDQIARLETVLGYLKAKDADKHEDAIAAVAAQLVRLREEHAALETASGDGWKTFDVRARYLSRTDGVPTGALDVYAMTKRDGSKVMVRLADHSKRLGDEVLTYESTEPTFEEALKYSFTKLCKSYPEGTVSLWAQQMDSTGEKATGKTVGFELMTNSVWNKMKAKIFNPLVQIASAAVMVPLLIFAPEVAVPLLIVNAVTSTAQSADELATRAQNGTLTAKRTGIALAQIGLNFLPLVRHARMVNMVNRIQRTTSEAAELTAYAVIEFGGQALLAVPQYAETLRRIEDEDVAAIAQMFVAIQELEKSTHPSDPRLADARSAIEARAAGVRDATYRAFNETAGTTLMFMWLDAATMHASSKGTNRPHSQWEPVHDGNPNIGKHIDDVGDHDGLYHKDGPQPEKAPIRPKPSTPHDFEPVHDKNAKPTKVVFTGDGDALAQVAQNIRPIAGHFDVVVHADANSFYLNHNGSWVRVTPETMQMFLQRHPGYTGGAIRLIACESGAAANGVAQSIANGMGVNVKAPSDVVWIFNDGWLNIGPDPYHPTGKWNDFTPQKQGAVAPAQHEPSTSKPTHSEPSTSKAPEYETSDATKVGKKPAANQPAAKKLPDIELPVLLPDGRFEDADIEAAYQDYRMRKNREGLDARDRIDWDDRVKWWKNDSPVARGNKFNASVRDRALYPYNEVNLVDGLRLDSYDPIAGERVSRKATDFGKVTEAEFRDYCREIDRKYPRGKVIRSDLQANQKIDGTKLVGVPVLEVPASNLDAKYKYQRPIFEAIAIEEGVELRYTKE